MRIGIKLGFGSGKFKIKVLIQYKGVKMSGFWLVHGSKQAGSEVVTHRPFTQRFSVEKNRAVGPNRIGK